MRKLLRKLMLQFFAMKTRFICWISYNIGCYRSITSTLEIYKNYTIKDLKRELYILLNIHACTGLDREYLRKLVSVRLSSGILRLLQISGSKNISIISEPVKLKELIEKELGIEIEDSTYGYRYYPRTPLFLWGTDCDEANKKRFELYSIVLTKLGGN